MELFDFKSAYWLGYLGWVLAGFFIYHDSKQLLRSYGKVLVLALAWPLILLVFVMVFVIDICFIKSAKGKKNG